MFKNTKIIGSGVRETVAQMTAMYEGSLHAIRINNDNGSAAEIVFHVDGADFPVEAEPGGSSPVFKMNLPQESHLEATVPADVTLSVSYIEQPVDDSAAASEAFLYAQQAEGFAGNAEQSAGEAEAHKNHAGTYKDQAESAAQAAASSVNESANNAALSEGSKTTAVASQLAAAALASTASSAASTAISNATKAEQWATATGIVEGGNKGAKGYALDAQAAASTAQSAAASLPDGVIDDNITSSTDTWSSEKIAQELEQAGEVEEAPTDGKQYARKNASWVEVEAGSSTTLVTIEFTALPTQVKELGNWVVEVSAEALLQGQSIVKFVANWSDGTTSTVPAVAGAATLTKAAPAYPEPLSVEVYAVDSLTNRSLTISATVEVLENQPPIGPITINHTSTVSKGGTFDVSLSGATDPDGDDAAIRYEITDTGILTFAKTTDIAAGELVQVTAPDVSVDTIATFSVRACDDLGLHTATQSSTVNVVVASVIGVKLVTTGGNGGTWSHIDDTGAEIATPSTSWFNAHPIFSGIVDQVIDGQSMVKVPKFYYKRGTAGGKAAWWISDQQIAGFEIFPAFILDSVEKDQFWYGKYQASESGGKLQSIAGVLPKVSISLTDSLTAATARNVGGVEGFRLHHYDMWLAIQWLYLVENATMDSQTKTGQGRVSASSAANVDASDVAEATYRGMVGLWGNVRQWMDGVRTKNNLIERRAYNGAWASTGESAPGNTYPTTFRTTSPDSFLPDTFETGNTNATLPDQVYWLNQANATEYHPYVGGYWTRAAGAGLWYVNCNGAASLANTIIGARLARIV